MPYRATTSAAEPSLVAAPLAPTSPAARLSQVDAVLEGIKAMIIGGHLRAGSRLPNHKDLAGALGVSQGPLREGVRALCIMGVLETRQGDGTYVTSLDARLLLAPLGFTMDLQTPEHRHRLHAVRRALESEVPGPAAVTTAPGAQGSPNYSGGMTSAPILTPEGSAFVTDRHLASLSTMGPDGRIHVVPVGFTYRDGLVRIITSGPSQKVANLRRDARATVSQVDGASWITLAGTARILDDPESVALAVELYSQRYRVPRANPLRVAIAVEVETAMGSAGMLS